MRVGFFKVLRLIFLTRIKVSWIWESYRQLTGFAVRWFRQTSWKENFLVIARSGGRPAARSFARLLAQQRFPRGRRSWAQQRATGAPNRHRRSPGRRGRLARVWQKTESGSRPFHCRPFIRGFGLRQKVSEKATALRERQQNRWLALGGERAGGRQ